MPPILLWRVDETNSDEFEVSKNFFATTKSRMAIPPNSFVVGRYGVLPYYRELEDDLKTNGSKLINSYRQHRYIADMGQWVADLEGITPKTWRSIAEVPFDENGPFVLKGETNSKKHLWNTHCFAPDRESIGRVIGELLDDSLISMQQLYIRKYEPLIKLADGLHGLPISKEFRYFVADQRIMSAGFYWSSHSDDIPAAEKLPPFDEGLVREAIYRIGDKASFYTIDVGYRIDGSPIVIEINDGQMAGLSDNNPRELYRSLAAVLK